MNNLQNKENEAIKRMDEMEARMARVEKLLAGMENRLMTIEELERRILQCLEYQGTGETPELSQPNRLPHYQETNSDARVEEMEVYPINRDWLK